MHQGITIRPQQVAKVPQILRFLGKVDYSQDRLRLQQKNLLVREIIEQDNSKSQAEAEAGIQGLRKSRQQLIYGNFNPLDLIQDANEIRTIVGGQLDPQTGQDSRLANQTYGMNINARVSQASQDIGSRIIIPTALIHSIYDCDEQRMH
ncbi:MAG: hypothetical protein EZS28_044430 [Streblomastix strix]|uniref:Uncharacterized protein n=1 Tax=Streblomastix strix TaxID=222440 RepID=A0A5J4TQ68_9EUKA|nr:MAG: hypothetical protein EZS28_044430 [Streblomastix strix]